MRMIFCCCLLLSLAVFNQNSKAGGMNKVFKLSKILVTNKLNHSRVNEVVTIDRGRFGKAKENLFPLLRQNGKVLVYQFDDLDDDAKWDRLLVEVSVKPMATIILSVNWVKANALPYYMQGTHVRFSKRSSDGKPTVEILAESRMRGFKQDISKPVYQLEGPGIENDKVAFRMFFDERNGKDIYGKLVDSMVLTNVGLKGSWHVLQNWGMDIFKYGNSFGAGGLAVQQGNTFYRLADADLSVYSPVSQGALQASFKIDFKGWDVGTYKGRGCELLTMVKGDFFYRDSVTIPYHNNQQFVIGMGNAGVDTFLLKKHNRQFISLSTYGKQVPGDTSALGVAILFSAAQYISSANSRSSDAIPNSTYAVLKNNPEKKCYYFFACWSRTDKRFATRQGFDDYLQQVADKLASPLQVKFIRLNN